MSSSSDQLSERLKYDSRMTEYALRQGLITKEDLEKHLKSLPDCASNADFVKMDEMGNKEDSLDSKH